MKFQKLTFAMVVLVVSVNAQAASSHVDYDVYGTAYGEDTKHAAGEVRTFHCVTPPAASKDGFIPGIGAEHRCAPHASDYNPKDWAVSLTTLLRFI